MLQPTKNFSLSEILRASGGSIPDALHDNANASIAWLQSVRDYLGRPILLTNFYRTPEKNASLPGHANNSQHMRALGMDFDVLGMTNHEAVASIIVGVRTGQIPTYHQLITYTTDHHVHGGMVGEEWGDDEQNLLQVAVGQYQPLTDAMLSQLANASVAERAANLVAQSGDVATAHPLVATVAVLLFLTPALFGGHWS